MPILKLQNGVSLTYPKGWVIKGRYGSQPGYDWNIVLRNKESILHVCQQPIGGSTFYSFKKDGSNRRGDVVLTKDSSGHTFVSRI